LEMPLSPPREMPPLSQETRVWVWGMHISESDLTSPVADGRISWVWVSRLPRKMQ
jgi:hypothetical protein